MSNIIIALSPDDIEAIAERVAARITPPAPVRDELVDEKEAALELGTAVKTLQSWRHRRTGPEFVKIGRSVRYPRRSLEAFKRRGAQP